MKISFSPYYSKNGFVWNAFVDPLRAEGYRTGFTVCFGYWMLMVEFAQ